MRQGEQVAPEAGKGREMDSSLEIPGGTSPAGTLTLAQGNWPPEVKKNKCVLLKATQFAVILQQPLGTNLVTQGTRCLFPHRSVEEGVSRDTGSDGTRLVRRGRVQNLV